MTMVHLPHRRIWLIPFEEPQFLLPPPQRSPAPRMLRLQELSIEIKICQISVRDLIDWLCQQVGQIGQAQWDLAGHGHWIPKPRHDGPPRSNQNDSLVWGVL